MPTPMRSKNSGKKGRPIRTRIVRNEPKTRQFSPRGRRGRPGYRELKIEEIEAIRLSDHIGLDQRQASKFMDISQQTFSRVLKSARKCVAEALINGEIIKVRGGVFKIDKAV
jgi:predicted DNA-binding protein (UPF0251 family)